MMGSQYKIKRTKTDFTERLLTCSEALSFIKDNSATPVTCYVLESWINDGTIKAYIKLPSIYGTEGTYKLDSGFESVSAITFLEWCHKKRKNIRKKKMAITTSHPLRAPNDVLFEAKNISTGERYRHINKVEFAEMHHWSLPLWFDFECLERVVAMLSGEKVPTKPKKQVQTGKTKLKYPQQEEVILSTLKRLGFNPMFLPISRGEAGAKSKVRNIALREYRELFYSKDAFNSAWKKIRRNGLIADEK